MDITQYLDIFISEAQDHLQAMNQALLELEKQPEHLDQLDSFFRAAHTLKGMSAALGFGHTAALSHALEDILDALRHKERQLSPGLADALFKCLDTLSESLQGIAAGEGEKEDTTQAQALLRSALGMEAHAQAAQPELDSLGATSPAQKVTPGAGWQICVEIAPDCALKGPRAWLVLKRLRTAAPILDSVPPQSALRAGQYEGGFCVLFAPAADPEALQRAANSVAEVTAVKVKQLAQVAVRQPELAHPPTAPAPLEQAAPTTAAEVAPVAPVVRIKTALLDQLLEAVADLVINRSHLAQVSAKYGFSDLKETVEAHAGVLDRLQETVLAMRMTPVAQVFNRFPRLVRDLAREQGKQVEFELAGTQIELDRAVLDKITDPLVHMLRNAVDHGLETPQERELAGKPPTAHISLRASRAQNKAIIEVHDDGRGMSPQQIANTAIQRGLITPQAAGEMDTTTILGLICQPGFSTKTQVTGVSGRGVGMEVVKQVMDEIGGVLEIESQPGQGTCFRLNFPLTMAILPAMLVRVGVELYALPLAHVIRTIEASRGELRQLHNQPVIDWEDKLLPLIFMTDVLGAGHASESRLTNGEEDTPFGNDGKLRLEPETLNLTPETLFMPTVIVERGRRRHGLVVDEIVGTEDIVLKPLPSLAQIDGLAGATIRGEGEVVLILDVAALVRS
ncbi:MAG: chemotaxis protein CheA [Thermoflexales bacterium]|nr:chemotaxis protein CheA [Thermoflexales bacterium]